MAFRQCECVLKLPDGRPYVITVTARSVYQAAMAFHEYCHDPLFPHRPKLTPESRVDIKPGLHSGNEKGVGLRGVVREPGREEGTRPAVIVGMGWWF
jgi:hypothetical protein